MPLTDMFRNYIAGMVTGAASTPFSEANARIGVGNGTTAFAANQTDLVGASKFRKPMDTGYPTVSSGAMTFRSTFATGDANYAWEEWGVFNAGPTGGVMMNRVVQPNGTKASSETKQVTVTITLSV